MFKKIHSNRNPEDTVFSEIRKEFAGHFNKAGSRIAALFNKYPRPVFGFMILLMLGSMILSFTVFRIPKKEDAGVTKPVTSLMQDGFSQILEKGAALKESIALKQQIESLIAKDSLSKADSVSLVKAIDKLHQLTIKPKKNYESH